MFAGYAILRTEADLDKILMLNMWIAIVVAGLGVIQTFGGGDFLTPNDIAPELYMLSHDVKDVSSNAPSKVCGQRPCLSATADSPFSYVDVDSDNWRGGLSDDAQQAGQYCCILRRRSRSPCYDHGWLSIDVYSDDCKRDCLRLGSFMGRVVVQRQAIRLGKVFTLIACVTAIGIFVATTFFPEAIKARWAIYSETLSPTSRIVRIE